MGDRGSNELHPSLGSVNSNTEDLKSSERHRNPEVGNVLRAWEKRSKTFSNQLNCRQRSRDSSVESYDDDQNHDMVTGANPTPHMVPEFLTGRPMQSREPLQRQNSNNNESQDTIPQVPETKAPNTSSDPINRLAEVLVGMNNQPFISTNTDGTPSQHNHTDVRLQIREIRTLRGSLSHYDKNAT